RRTTVIPCDFNFRIFACCINPELIVRVQKSIGFIYILISSDTRTWNDRIVFHFAERDHTTEISVQREEHSEGWPMIGNGRELEGVAVCSVLFQRLLNITLEQIISFRLSQRGGNEKGSNELFILHWVCYELPKLGIRTGQLVITY